MRICIFLLLLLGPLKFFSQEGQKISKPFSTEDGIYGTVNLTTKPTTFGGGYILIQQDNVIIEGIKYNGKNFSENQLSSHGVIFPMESSNCYFYASGQASMLIPGSVERDYGNFEKGGPIGKGGFLKTRQEVLFSENAKERHNANKTNGSPWENTGRVEKIKLNGFYGEDLRTVRKAVEFAMKK